jgi:hypothetical protein
LSGAFRDAVIEHASTIFRVKDGPPITAEIAQRFRIQVNIFNFYYKKFDVFEISTANIYFVAICVIVI